MQMIRKSVPRYFQISAAQTSIKYIKNIYSFLDRLYLILSQREGLIEHQQFQQKEEPFNVFSIFRNVIIRPFLLRGGGGGLSVTAKLNLFKSLRASYNRTKETGVEQCTRLTGLGEKCAGAIEKDTYSRSRRGERSIYGEGGIVISAVCDYTGDINAISVFTIGRSSNLHKESKSLKPVFLNF